MSDGVPAACSPMQSRIQPTVPSPPQARMRKSGVSRKKLSLDGAKRERRSRSRAGGCRGRVGAAAGGRGTSVPGSGPATVQVVHLPRVEQVVKLSEDPGKERERGMPRRRVHSWQLGHPNGTQTLAVGPGRDAVPGQGHTYRSPCLPPLLGFTNTSRGCVPGLGLICEAERKHERCKILAPAGPGPAGLPVARCQTLPADLARPPWWR